MPALLTELPGQTTQQDPEATEFSIQETTGQERSVTLGGRAMPYQPVSWSGTQRTALTWYAGNPEATQQILGPTEEPTEVAGMWKDRFIRGQVRQQGFFEGEIEFAQDMVALFTDLRASGQVLRVSWGPETRFGVMTDFAATYLRLQDIRWSATFEWHRRGLTVPVVSPAEQLPTAISQSLAGMNEVAAFRPAGTDAPALLNERAPSPGPGSPPLLDRAQGFVAGLVSSVAAIRRQAGAVLDVVRQVRALAAAPATLVNSALSAVDAVRFQALSETCALASTPLPFVTSERNAARQLETEAWRREMAAALGAVLDAMGRAAEQLREESRPGSTQTYQATSQTTLYAVSNRFYGDPDSAGFLRDVNLLDTMTVPSGFVVLIPPRPDL